MREGKVGGEFMVIRLRGGSLGSGRLFLFMVNWLYVLWTMDHQSADACLDRRGVLNGSERAVQVYGSQSWNSSYVPRCPNLLVHLFSV